MVKLLVSDVDKMVGKRMQLRRKEVGLTVAQLSESVGITQQQLSRYERGTNKINLAHLLLITRYLDTPISWFFIECEVNDTNKLKDEREKYISIRDDDLKVRLEQHWSQLTHDQKRAFIILLDSITI